MKPAITILILLFICNFANAQTQLNDSAIAKVMQKLADTTVILQYPSVWNNGPLLHILSKKGDTINAYTYQSPTQRMISSSVPKAIARAILLKDLRDYASEPVGINRYFTINNINPDTLKKLWSDMLKLRLWEIKDDAIEGAGCPITKHSNVSIEDGGGIYILLISSIESKPLNFYAPDEFERLCPGRKGRQTAIKLSGMVNQIFKE